MISKIQILRGDYDVEMTSSQIPSGNARSYREYSMYDRLRFENKDRQVLLLFSVSGIVQNNDFGFSAFVTMVSSKGPRIYDGQKWLDVKNNEAANTGVHVPVPPTNHGNGAIFINIASYRDGKRCASTLQSLFENAKNPDKVFVGLIEQNSPEEAFCIEEYCKIHGAKMLKRIEIRKDTTKVMLDRKFDTNSCPHYNQIRSVAIHDIAAKGPGYARALGRKVLGNEEFCMQIDSHTTFTKNWDAEVKSQWLATKNEFGIISTVPADVKDKKEYETGGTKFGEVPRQCLVSYSGGSDIPSYESPADATAIDLTKPLLSHAWSAAFSFAKCHFEESVPYDSFAPYVMGAEQFTRFARLWTRGYDVYTPTKNIVFHDYSPNPDGHKMSEWMKPRRERIKKDSLQRFRTFLQIGDGDPSDKAQANLGIYGLGKRRTLAQLNNFVGINLFNHQGNRQNKKCLDHTWVPYDATHLPTDNLFTNADDLDPQPEYPLRTDLVFYKQDEWSEEAPVGVDSMRLAAIGQEIPEPGMMGNHQGTPRQPPTTALFLLWIVGLIAWCIIFVLNPESATASGGEPTRRKNKKGLAKDA